MKQYPGVPLSLVLILGQFISPSLFAQQLSSSYFNPYYRSTIQSGGVTPASPKWRDSGWRFPAWNGQVQAPKPTTAPVDVYAVGYVNAPSKFQPLAQARQSQLPQKHYRRDAPKTGYQPQPSYSSAARGGQWYFRDASAQTTSNTQSGSYLERFSYSERAGTRYHFRNPDASANRGWINRNNWGQSVWNDSPAASGQMAAQRAPANPASWGTW